MVVINIGETTAKIIISDNVVPANGTYAWYITTDNTPALFNFPRKPIAAVELAAETNILKKRFDATGVYRFNKVIIQTAAEWDSLMDALDTWDVGDTRLWLSVKNEWAVELATRGTFALPTTQGRFRGKCFAQVGQIEAARVLLNIEFRYTTA